MLWGYRMESGNKNFSRYLTVCFDTFRGDSGRNIECRMKSRNRMQSRMKNVTEGKLVHELYT